MHNLIFAPGRFKLPLYIHYFFGIATASCLTSATGSEYVGKRGISKSGRPCQRWDRQFPHQHNYTLPYMFPDTTVTEAENFCRNPDNFRNGVWCYTTDKTMEWEYCDIPVCSGTYL
jgi:hypothetical protein